MALTGLQLTCDHDPQESGFMLDQANINQDFDEDLGAN